MCAWCHVRVILAILISALQDDSGPWEQLVAMMDGSKSLEALYAPQKLAVSKCNHYVPYVRFQM